MDNAIGRINYEAFVRWLADFHEQLSADFPATMPWVRVSPYVQCAFQAGAEAVLGQREARVRATVPKVPVRKGERA